MKRILLLLFISFTHIQAQVIQIGSLDEVITIARNQSYTLEQIQMQAQLSSYDSKIAASSLLPSLTANAQSDYNLKLPVQLIPAEIFGGAPGTFNEVRFGQDWNSNAGANFELPIIHADKFARAKVASKTRDQAIEDSKNNTNNYLQLVCRAYLNLLVLREASVLNSTLDTTATELYNTTKAFYNQQLASKVELNRAENLMLTTLQQTQNVIASTKITLNQLKALLGIDLSDELLIDDQLNNYFIDKVPNDIAAENRAVTKASELAVEAAAWNIKQQNWMFLPKISFNSRYTFANQSNTLFSGQGTNFNYGTVGLSVSMPLFKGFSQYNQQRKAKLQLNIATAQWKQSIIDSKAELSEWKIKFEDKRQSREFAIRRDELAENTLNLSLLNYNEGVISLNELFNIYNEHVQARNNRLQTTADALLYLEFLKLEQN
ncbi:MAG: TolC family protein [Bacteroidia bacterium]